jgi:hypothetical protein
MNDYPVPTLADEDIDVFIEWLGQKPAIGPKAIDLVIKTLIGLRNDRIILHKKIEELHIKLAQGGPNV